MLETLTHLAGQSVELITRDQLDLSNQNHDEHDGSKERYEEDLEVKLHQSDPCRPVKRLPRVKHGHGAAATQDLRFDFTSEGAVEGDNGFILLRQHGSLDTFESDVGGNDDGDEEADANKTDEEHLQQGNILRAANIFIDLFVECLEAEGV